MNDLKTVRAAIGLLMDASCVLPPKRARECIAVSDDLAALHAKLSTRAENLQELSIAIDDVLAFCRRLT